MGFRNEFERTEGGEGVGQERAAQLHKEIADTAKSMPGQRDDLLTKLASMCWNKRLSWLFA
jgi:hypothetical protein